MNASWWKRWRKSNGNPADLAVGRRRAARALTGMRVRVEGLEHRLTMSTSADLVGGQLLIVGDSATVVITFDHSGSTHSGGQ